MDSVLDLHPHVCDFTHVKLLRSSLIFSSVFFVRKMFCWFRLASPRLRIGPLVGDRVCDWTGLQYVIQPTRCSMSTRHHHGHRGHHPLSTEPAVVNCAIVVN